MMWKEMMHLGDRIKLLSPFKPGNATVVDLFPEGVVPDKEKVEKYYQFKPGEHKPISVFGNTKTNRWILLRDEGGYIILPESWRNERMFEHISIDKGDLK